MTYDDYIALGPEDRMLARLNDLALAAARQDSIEMSRMDLDNPEETPEVLVAVDRRSQFLSAASKVQMAAVEEMLRNRRHMPDVAFSKRSGKGGQPGQDWLEIMSQKAGVDVATFRRVIETIKLYGTKQETTKQES